MVGEVDGVVRPRFGEKSLDFVDGWSAGDRLDCWESTREMVDVDWMALK